jgi:HEAT repeat protein
MRLEELEEMMTEEPAEAEAAIAEIAAGGNVDQLAHIAKATHQHEVRLSTIEQLGMVGGPEATEALVEMLEAANTPLAIGGTEQRMERAAVQARLIRALARTRGVRPPAVQSQSEIAEFIESIRNG